MVIIDWIILVGKVLKGAWVAAYDWFLELPEGVQIAILGTIAAGLIIWFVNDRAFDRGYAKREAEWQEAIKKAKDKQAAQIDKASAAFEKDKAHAEVIYRDRDRIVTKIVERPIYRNVCLDADGLSVANAALAGSPYAAGKPDKPLP